MNWYSKDLMQTSKLLGTSLEYGLSAEEAKRLAEQIRKLTQRLEK